MIDSKGSGGVLRSTGWSRVPRIGCLPDAEQEVRADADLDILATALYARTDDLLKSHPERVPYRSEVGIAPQITDAEVITLSVMQALLGHTSEARWLRHVTANLRHLFPYLPQQPGYNKRLRKLAGILRHEPVCCAGCGRPAARAVEVGVERRQVLDLPRPRYR